jgi:signal transduction histidine kinase
MHEAAPLDNLRLEVEELRASRARVVATADGERRRIERGLHDGVQQHLVALAVSLQLARELADSDPSGLKALLEEIRRDVHDALESVRAIAHGIYPSLLIDRGLADALRGAAAGLGFRTRVEATTDRYPPDIEAAVYFCCLEALDAVEQAGPKTQATVRLALERGAVVFEVVIDGADGQDKAESDVTLTAMNDRLGAVGGRLSVSSEGGRTHFVGTITVKP